MEVWSYGCDMVCKDWKFSIGFIPYILSLILKFIINALC